jgi:hypothetical protein
MDVTYYVALPFVAADDGVAAGEAVECFNPNAAVMRAEALSRKPRRRSRLQPDGKSRDRRLRRRDRDPKVWRRARGPQRTLSANCGHSCRSTFLDEAIAKLLGRTSGRPTGHADKQISDACASEIQFCVVGVINPTSCDASRRNYWPLLVSLASYHWVWPHRSANGLNQKYIGYHLTAPAASTMGLLGLRQRSHVSAPIAAGGLPAGPGGAFCAGSAPQSDLGATERATQPGRWPSWHF